MRYLKASQRARTNAGISRTLLVLLFAFLSSVRCVGADKPGESGFTPKFLVDYLNSQLVVSECVFSMTNNVLKSKFEPRVLPADTHGTTYYFFGRIQSNAFSLTAGRTRFPTFSSITNLGAEFHPAYGRWENSFWGYGAPGQMTTATDTGQLQKEGRMRGCFLYEKTFREITALGIRSLRHGSVVLSPTNTEFRALMLESDHEIKGTFLVGSNQQVQGIRYQLGKMGSHFEVRYGGGLLAPHGIPREITLSYVYPPNPDLVTIYRFQHLLLEDALLLRPAFEPEGLRTFRINRGASRKQFPISSP